MKIIFALLIIVAIIGIAWALIELSRVYYNIKSLRNVSRYPGMAKRREGIIYNETTHELEADQSLFTPL